MSGFQQNSLQDTGANGGAPSQLNFSLDSNRGQFWQDGQDPRPAGSSQEQQPNFQGHLSTFNMMQNAQIGGKVGDQEANGDPSASHSSFGLGNGQMDKISQIGAQINQ